jgi:tRNA/tmRNA/rRNA uracil-C5-methylase (TrmA/RlmC/RlmD family)
MVGLVTSPGVAATGFADAVRAAWPNVTSIVHGAYGGRARGVLADSVDTLYGEAHIEEQLHVPDGDRAHKLRFRISPLSFFQTNTLGTEVLYGKIRHWVRQAQPKILYDLYGGSGGIALSCADLVDACRSVESVADATGDGEFNARANKVENVHFTAALMKKYLQELVESGGMESTSAAIVDPPRPGMTPKPLKRLVQSRPPKLFYVSCNSAVLAEEMPPLLDAYRLESLEAVDLFPHTPHVEVLASFALK